MQKILHFGVVCALITIARAASNESKSFLKDYSNGLGAHTSIEGRRQWDKLTELFLKESNPELIALSLRTKPISQKDAIQRAMVHWELIRKRPKSYITGVYQFDKSFNCILPILVPRTQFIKFDDISSYASKIKNKQKEHRLFITRSAKYFKELTNGSLDLKNYSCK
jgi:hypothetical protein